MYLDNYFRAVDEIFTKIRETQREAIVNAADIIAESLANHGGLFVMDTGHMLRHEAFNRAGGLMVITPFAYHLDVDCPAEHREIKRTPEQAAELEERTVALALDQSKMKHGDVLIISSNSGRTSNVIEVALQCQGRGIMTVGISSVQQMTNCPVDHVSGMKLFDVADVCIDNCGPHGDALLEVKDNERMCPGSGMAATFILWSIQAEAVERLQARGVNPTIFRSIHVSGLEHVDEQRRKFLERGV